MSRYDLWLFLHVAGTIVWVGGAVVVQVFGALTQRAADPGLSAAFGRNSAWTGTWVFMTASALVLLTGLALTGEGNWSWGEPFVLVGIVGWAIVAGVVFGYVSPTLKRLSRQMALEGPSPELAARVRSTILVARVSLGLLFVIVFFMVVKLGT